MHRDGATVAIQPSPFIGRIRKQQDVTSNTFKPAQFGVKRAQAVANAAAPQNKHMIGGTP